MNKLQQTIAFSIILLSQLVLAANSKLVVYTARKEHLIKPIFEKYKKETGTEIEYITGESGVLLQRLKAEGKNSPADMFITVDAGNLWHAADAGVLDKVESKTLEKNIPAHLRDPNHQWFGLSIRARTLFYNPKKVKQSELVGYKDLANANWKKRLCLRTSKKVYNQSLVAMMIADLGEKNALSTIKSWVANLAAPVFSNDTSMLEAIAAGQCDVGIANTYYYGRLMKEKPNLSVNIFWADQKTTGTHVNISGAGITKYSKHKKEAVKFLEWMSSENAQNLFADENMEYPVNPKIKPAKVVAAWGEFKANKRNVAEAGKLQVKAVQLMDKAKYK